MPLLTLRDITITYGHPPLLSAASCVIEPGQRIGLLGRNGSGKTTLLRILAGGEEADSGEVALEAGAAIAYLPQDVPTDLVGTTREVIEGGVPILPGGEVDWQAYQQVDRIITEMNIDPDALVESLSSGMKRRVLLARALSTSPDLLLLDEPTNHLDLDAIDWLEKFLARWQGTVVFVTHDRAFLRRLATRILEIERGRLYDWSCDYGTFLVRKEASIAAEERQEALFDKKLAQEEVWIRQGIQARRTRNEGRVRALEAMRRTREDRRPVSATMNLEVQSADRSGQLVAKAKGLSFGYTDGAPIVSEFSTTIFRGDKIGIVGPNGAGKTTLLRLLLGQLEPQEGAVKLGTNLEIAYFDQLRDQLDLDASLQDNVADGADTVQIGGRKRHIMGYLEDFLFSKERARMPVKLLSGGERMRVLLARLFAKPANVIVLDEPTNDLDTESLELLEERLVQFEGTVLVVSHDREFLDNVVGSVIAFEEDGVREYVGGHADWQRQKAARDGAASVKTPSKAGSSATPPKAKAPPKKRLNFREQKELAGLPAAIEEHEAEIERIHELMAQPDFYKRPGDEISTQQAKLSDVEGKLAAATVRWEELEARV